MKTRPYKNSGLITLCFIFSAHILIGQTLERTINKNFPLNPKGKITIDNSYGVVKLNSWDKNEVAIEVVIKVKGANKARAAELLDKIEINFDSSASNVYASTLLPDSRQAWWKSFSFFGSNNLDYSINYLVQMPKTAALDIENEYGNIYIDETEGATHLVCAYGRLEAGSLKHSENTIEISYAPNSTIDYIYKANIEADYSGLSIGESNAIEYDADYSKSKFGRIDKLNFDADYGSLRLAEVSTLIGEADYLTISIGQLKRQLDLQMDYGSIKVDQIAASTTAFTIDSDYTGIQLGADPNWDFAFTVETEYAGFKSDFPLDYKKKIIESTERFYQGQHRNGTHQLNIKADYGNIKLTQN